ncbi:MAG: SUMF1/EgtB/PvdO family nonheme iron enzyme [Bacteroidetes bacterium]|jgi:hypothetical protein|nr:SUMF1/EgtB/PvdO family nonheme iron enzyme [Bacteroidota bacterium]MBP8916517.1 SUMF1/EgtB/PvdO family nonheme iron enzyme [Chitinophagales bacterium]MBP9190580.1 SUMF1/EgtB/PvdO family nonheme iron enzyme [Chitinophagales bacterium]MBP9795570.1 SUMF1/EgtB/PvdO family nonheme iron enzyme [Chitinophagales bacterium]
MAQFLGVFLLNYYFLFPIGNNPTGTIAGPGKEFYVDEYEITNLAWREFLFFMEEKDSNNLSKLVPDSASWYKVYSGNYLKPNDFDNYPVVGIDFFQVSLFCEWRSEVVSKRTGKEIIYYLPSKEEFNLAVDFFNKNEFTAKLSDVHIIDKKSKVKGLCSNVSEMTNVEGFAMGANWNSESASCYLQSTYTENSEYVGFRCFAKFVK